MGMFSGKDKQFTTSSGIVVSNVREDVPEFRRTYKKVLNSRAVIDVEVHSMPSWLSWSGTLTQPNGNRVYFDPQKIAEKIIDPLLVPLVENAVEEIERVDAEYRGSKPSTYVDEKGHTWRRAWRGDR